jgi:uncharacterized protein DUF4375
MSDTDNDLIIAISDVLAPLSSRRFEALSPEEQAFMLVWALEADLNNGGFNQYFFNSNSDHAAAVPGAMRTIGAPQTAEVVERALALFPDGVPPTSRDERQDLLEEIDPDEELFESLDDAFLAYPHDLTALLAGFARANRSAIRGA